MKIFRITFQGHDLTGESIVVADSMDEAIFMVKVKQQLEDITDKWIHAIEIDTTTRGIKFFYDGNY